MNMKNQTKYFLKYIILFLIQIIERFEYRKLFLNQNDNTKKILSEIKLDDIEINTPQGFKKATQIYKTQPYTVWILKTENGLNLECADNHILFNSLSEQVFIKDLHISDYIQTKFGLDKIIKLKKLPFKVSMYDISVDSIEHEFYSNNIISHNTTTVAAFFAWYLSFHCDRNLAILANKQLTAIEIVAKVLDIFKGLPFFLKPGISQLGAMGMKLDNGCQLFSQATTKTAQIGFTIHVLYADEFAHIQPGIVKHFWKSVYPTLASSLISQCVISSTPAGQGNLFFEIWDKAMRGISTFLPIRVDYWEVPEHDQTWAEQMKKDFGEEEFAQEFELQFDVDSRLLLNAKELAFLKKIAKDYIFDTMDKTELSDTLYRNLKWKPGFDINAEFDKKTTRFAIAVDLGEGKEEGEKKDNDSNVLSIFQVEPKSLAQLRKLRKDQYNIKNMFRFNQVGLYKDNFKDEENCAKVCKSIIFDQFGEDMSIVAIEMNFNGKLFLNVFSNHLKYNEDVILHTHHTKPIPGEKTSRKKPGFKVGADKDYFCKLAKKLIGEKTMVPNDNITIAEFKSFGRDKKGKYKGIGMHDDAAMSTINISRLYEEQYYEDFLYDFLDSYPDCETKKLINKLLEIVEDTSDVDDKMFDALYQNDNAPLTEQQRLLQIFNNPSQSYHPSMSTWKKS